MVVFDEEMMNKKMRRRFKVV